MASRVHRPSRRWRLRLRSARVLCACVTARQRALTVLNPVLPQKFGHKLLCLKGGAQPLVDGLIGGRRVLDDLRLG